MGSAENVSLSSPSFASALPSLPAATETGPKAEALPPRESVANDLVQSIASNLQHDKASGVRDRSKLFYAGAVVVGLAATVAGAFFPPLYALFLLSALLTHKGIKASFAADNLRKGLPARVSEDVIFKKSLESATNHSEALSGKKNAQFDMIQQRLEKMYANREKLPSDTRGTPDNELAVVEAKWKFVVQQMASGKEDLQGPLERLENALNRYETHSICSLTSGTRKLEGLIPDEAQRSKFRKLVARYEKAEKNSDDATLTERQAAQKAFAALYSRLLDEDSSKLSLKEVRTAIKAWEKAIKKANQE